MTEPVELSPAEQEAITALSQALGQGGLPVHPQMVEAIIRRIARQEIASLAGLVLARTQEEHLTRSPEHNLADDAVRSFIAEVFGEVLSDFSGHTGGGDSPGDD